MVDQGRAGEEVLPVGVSDPVGDRARQKEPLEQGLDVDRVARQRADGIAAVS